MVKHYNDPNQYLTFNKCKVNIDFLSIDLNIRPVEYACISIDIDLVVRKKDFENM